MKKAKKVLAGASGKKVESPAPSKRRHRETRIEHHGDGSHTVRHTPMDASEGGSEVSYTAADLDELHDGLEKHIGEPNHDEAPEVKR